MIHYMRLLRISAIHPANLCCMHQQLLINKLQLLPSDRYSLRLLANIRYWYFVTCRIIKCSSRSIIYHRTLQPQKYTVNKVIKLHKNIQETLKYKLMVSVLK